MSHGQRTATATERREPTVDAFPPPRSWNDQSHGWPEPRHRFAFVVATLNGAGTVGPTTTACARQADTFVVSDGSTDDTAAVARRHGATAVVELTTNVGKPAAIHAAVAQLRLLDLYEQQMLEAELIDAYERRWEEEIHDLCPH